MIVRRPSPSRYDAESFTSKLLSGYELPYLDSGTPELRALGIRFLPAIANLFTRMGKLAQPWEAKQVQRFYSTFPGAWRGLGLALLRVATGLTLVIQGCVLLPGLRDFNMAIWAVCMLALMTGAWLIAGFLTPLGGVLAALIGLGMTFLIPPAETWNLLSRNPLSFDFLVMACACALLGPGAFSLDARLFGRRRIIIPRRAPSRAPNA